MLIHNPAIETKNGVLSLIFGAAQNFVDEKCPQKLE
jgi:hypothetical protein